MSNSSKHFIDMKIKTRRIMIFGKSNDPDSHQVKQIFGQYFIPKDLYEWIDIEKRQDCKQLENYFRILCFIDRRKTPYIFFSGSYFGALNELYQAHIQGVLLSIIHPRSTTEYYHEVSIVSEEAITNETNTLDNVSNAIEQLLPNKILFRFVSDNKNS